MNTFSQEIQEVIASVGKGKNLPSWGADGRYNPKTGVLYVAGRADQIEQNSLLLAKNSEEIGVTNIDKAMLQYPFVVTGLRAVFAGGVDGTSNSKNTAFTGKASPAFENGELTIDQSGELIKIPIGVITNLRSSTGIADDIYKVNPFVIREKKVFKMTPDLAGAPAANEIYKFELHGFYLQPDATV
ncbi:hypothetical protein FLCU109888_11510 [Flavobacterium cucumis]|uniref:Uncharacterized protein n=1 Tax=Flavobacterium cucumis TaxID=416016 RepID=A0A1M7ZVH5_9FLAO|nr:hypothetical protein [Flavobacterium cucumis]SHO72878.1 hypothetical protein SAMN05443547_1222 [Flavobacterium cucumis]